MSRQDELAAGLQAVRQRIANATADAGCGTEPVLIVVTKFFPASDVAALATLGVQDVGENRDQEASAKAAETAVDPDCAGLRWHFIGQLQSNKAKSVVRYAAAVHSVDRLSVIKALNKAMATEHQACLESGTGPRKNMKCFIQVNLGETAGAADQDVPVPAADRGGADPADVLELASKVENAEHLDLAGVMAVAPLGSDPDEAFGRLADVSRQLRDEYPHADAVSAGMSGDLEQAIKHGATHLRVGSNVLGQRPGLR